MPVNQVSLDNCSRRCKRQQQQKKQHDLLLLKLSPLQKIAQLWKGSSKVVGYKVEYSA